MGGPLDAGGSGRSSLSVNRNSLLDSENAPASEVLLTLPFAFGVTRLERAAGFGRRAFCFRSAENT